MLPAVDLEESRSRRAEARARRDAARRRGGLLAGVAVLALVGGALTGARSGDSGDRTNRTAASGEPVAAARQEPPPPPELPRGGRRLFPDWRLVGFYGAPQDRQLGALGIGSPSGMVKRLERAARPYARKTRPVLPLLELIATIANADPGADGKYRSRQPREVIDRYHRAARRAKALLLLDIQPGHADFEDEVRRLEPWLREPDVGLALDPEWHTPGAKPGTVIGSVEAAQVNRISRRLQSIVRKYRLPEKLFVLHQFTDDMLGDRDQIELREGVATVINVDGFGGRAAKVSKYRGFTSGDGRRFHHGFKLFYEEDTGLMRPRSVLAMGPPPDVVVYE